GQTFAARKRPGEDVGVREQLPDHVPSRFDSKDAFEFHCGRYTRPAAAIARLAWTRAKWVRNSLDAWRSLSASTPSVTCAPAAATTSAVSAWPTSARSAAAALNGVAATPVTPTAAARHVPRSTASWTAMPTSAKPDAGCRTFS